jgi:hypothetical protein
VQAQWAALRTMYSEKMKKFDAEAIGTRRSKGIKMANFLADYVDQILLIVVSAFILERALALVFEQDFFLALNKNNRFGWAKEFIAFGVSYAVCFDYKFDALSKLFSTDTNVLQPTNFGEVITAMVIAGGSKAVMKLMQGYLGIKKDIKTDGGS